MSEKWNRQGQRDGHRDKRCGSRCGSGWSPLRCAAAEQTAGAERGRQIAAAMAFERTMRASQKMLRAAAKGDIRTLEDELLVEHHVDAVESGGNGHSSLHAASEGGQEECVRWLVEKGCDVNIVSTKHRHTPLHIAGSPAVAVALLEAGASAGARDKMRQTPLQRFRSIKISGDKATRLLAQQIVDVLAAWVPSLGLSLSLAVSLSLSVESVESVCLSLSASLALASLSLALTRRG